MYENGEEEVWGFGDNERTMTENDIKWERWDDMCSPHKRKHEIEAGYDVPRFERVVHRQCDCDRNDGPDGAPMAWDYGDERGNWCWQRTPEWLSWESSLHWPEQGSDGEKQKDSVNKKRVKEMEEAWKHDHHHKWDEQFFDASCGENNALWEVGTCHTANHLLCQRQCLGLDEDDDELDQLSQQAIDRWAKDAKHGSLSPGSGNCIRLDTKQEGGGFMRQCYPCDKEGYFDEDFIFDCDKPKTKKSNFTSLQKQGFMIIGGAVLVVVFMFVFKKCGRKDSSSKRKKKRHSSSKDYDRRKRSRDRSKRRGHNKKPSRKKPSKKSKRP